LGGLRLKFGLRLGRRPLSDPNRHPECSCM
jgi:hypothetical protein